MASCQVNQVIRKLLISFHIFPLAVLLSFSSSFHKFHSCFKVRKKQTNLMCRGHSNVHDILVKSQIADSILSDY